MKTFGRRHAFIVPLAKQNTEETEMMKYQVYLLPLLVGLLGCDNAAGKGFLSELMVNIGMFMGLALIGIIISLVSTGKKK